jgi:hypothetical protein
MSVIINELEVVVETPTEPATAEPSQQEQETPLAPPMAPQDVGDIMRHHAQRIARLRAH